MANYASLFTGTPGGEPPRPPEPARPAVYRILLVDDEPNVLKALQRVFRQENYGIVLAHNGQEAIEQLRKDPFHLMISDYMMPGMTGAQVLKQAKAIQPDMEQGDPRQIRPDRQGQGVEAG